LRASGRLTKEDYVEVLEPALKEGVDAGGIRILFVLESYDGMALDAMAEDIRTGARAWFRDHSSWRRMAIVTDIGWATKGTRAFAWVAPGELEVFPLAELEAARSWVAG